MVEAGPCLSVTQAKLAISVATADVDITSLCHHNRMMKSGGHQLYPFPVEVLDEAGPEHIL